MMVLTDGEALAVQVRGYAQARLIGQHSSAVGLFLDTNDTSYLHLFIGRSVTDTNGHRHPLETDPNTLYSLASGGGDDFSRIYRINL